VRNLKPSDIFSTDELRKEKILTNLKLLQEFTDQQQPKIFLRGLIDAIRDEVKKL
jgi:hypothetical protein